MRTKKTLKENSLRGNRCMKSTQSANSGILGPVLVCLVLLSCVEKEPSSAKKSVDERVADHANQFLSKHATKWDSSYGSVKWGSSEAETRRNV